MNTPPKLKSAVALACLCPFALLAPSLHAQQIAKSPVSHGKPVVRNLGIQRVITFTTVRTEKEGIVAEHW